MILSEVDLLNIQVRQSVAKFKDINAMSLATPKEANKYEPGNTKGEVSIPLTSCLTGFDWPVMQIKTKIISSNTADSKPGKQEVNSIVIIPPLVFPI
jgi:hypothetical protein